MSKSDILERAVRDCLGIRTISEHDTAALVQVMRQWIQMRDHGVSTSMSQSRARSPLPPVPAPAPSPSVPRSGNRWIQTLPWCSWSKPPHFAHAYWDSPRARQFTDTIQMLNDADIRYFLTEGQLIGAWRHGGPLPCEIAAVNDAIIRLMSRLTTLRHHATGDDDLDLVFPAWLNPLPSTVGCTDARVPTLRGYDIGQEDALTLCGATRGTYTDETEAWLKQRLVSCYPTLEHENNAGWHEFVCVCLVADFSCIHSQYSRRSIIVLATSPRSER